MKKSEYTEYVYLIKYGGQTKKFSLKLLPDRLGFAPGSFRDDPPSWARLEVHKCRICPLKLKEHPICPAALSIADIAEEFTDMLSYQPVYAQLITPERRSSGKFPAQTALSSVMGLCLALSGCPVLKELAPLGKFHLPFSTVEETMYRTAGNYLLKQYFIYKGGGKADWELKGLKELYGRVALVNLSLSDRLRSFLKKDAGVNALIVLDNNAKNIEYLFEDAVGKIRNYYYKD